MWKFLGTIIATCFLLCTTNGQNTPQTCAEKLGQPIANYSQLTGIWWEVARNPISRNTYNCVMVNLTMLSDNILIIETTYSILPNSLWINQTMYTTLTLPQPNNMNYGYDISYIDNQMSTPYVVYNLLNTDFDSYALFCGYTNASDPNTSFAMVLTRDRFPSTSTLNAYESSAYLLQYPLFLNGSMPTILQSPVCTGGALSRYSFAILIFAIFNTILQFLM